MQNCAPNLATKSHRGQFCGVAACFLDFFCITELGRSIRSLLLDLAKETEQGNFLQFHILFGTHPRRPEFLYEQGLSGMVRFTLKTYCQDESFLVFTFWVSVTPREHVKWRDAFFLLSVQPKSISSKPVQAFRSPTNGTPAVYIFICDRFMILPSEKLLVIPSATIDLLIIFYESEEHRDHDVLTFVNKKGFVEVNIRRPR